MEHGCASFASIFAVIETFNCDAVLAVDLCFTVGFNFFVSSLASHLNDSSCYTLRQYFVNYAIMLHHNHIH
uniref:Uncharacterized protein n=1 Tax=Cannabis sativa TaxID=3483 RepID=A0A803R835_CANSA